MTLKSNKEIQQNECKIIKKITIIAYTQVNTNAIFFCNIKTSENVLWLLYQFPAKQFFV